MRLSPVFNRAFLIVVVFAGYRYAYGDAVITSAATTFGTLISISQTNVSFQAGCSGPATTIAWQDILLLRLDGQCSPHEATPPTAPLQVCKSALVHVFKVRTNGKFIYLSTASMSEVGILRGILYGKQGSVSLRRRDIGYIQPTDVCPASTSELDLPRGVCFEPQQFAVNWSTDPVFDNHIFTKGFAIYVKPEKAITDELRQEILMAFGTSINLWSSLLQDHKGELNPTLRAYVEKSESHGGNYVLFTPPQVIEVQCPENALIVIDWLNGRNGVFPPHQGYIARAQLQGRTILVNASENEFGYRADFKNPLSAGLVNLISVFAHEFGHCLGLPDDTTDSTSLMNPNHVAISLEQVVFPSLSDFHRLRGSLEATIVGSSAGFFEVKNCAGLRRLRSGRPSE
jgi:hypothetical protein